MTPTKSKTWPMTKSTPQPSGLNRQLMSRLKKARDPRVLGDGSTFDKPPYVAPAKAPVVIMAGLCVRQRVFCNNIWFCTFNSLS